jgi:hypothetical protein
LTKTATPRLLKASGREVSMIPRILLALAATAVAAPVLAQPPAPARPVAVGPGPIVQAVPVGPDANPQGFRGRGGRRNRGDFQGGGPNGGGRRFGRDQATPDAAPALSNPTPVASSAAVVAQGRAIAPRPPVGPPPAPDDAMVMRKLQGSISAVFDPGAKTARVKLIETDDHGVEGVRMLKPGEIYRDGWRLGAVTATQATLRKGRSVLHVDFTRGWPAPIQPAVLVQPVAPVLAVAPPGGRRGPSNLAPVAGRGPTPANPALGLSNARAGGSPPPPPRVGYQSLQGPNGPISIQTNADGSRTVTTTINGQVVTTTLQGNFGAR